MQIVDYKGSDRIKGNKKILIIGGVASRDKCQIATISTSRIFAASYNILIYLFTLSYIERNDFDNSKY